MRRLFLSIAFAFGATTATAAVASAITGARPKLAGRDPIILYVESDNDSLSPYQCA